MSLMFKVIDGDFLDIDVQVRVLTHHLVCDISELIVPL